MLCPKSSQIEFLLVALSNSEVPQTLLAMLSTSLMYNLVKESHFNIEISSLTPIY